MPRKFSRNLSAAKIKENKAGKLRACKLVILIFSTYLLFKVGPSVLVELSVPVRPLSLSLPTMVVYFNFERIEVKLTFFSPLTFFSVVPMSPHSATSDSCLDLQRNLRV